MAGKKAAHVTAATSKAGCPRLSAETRLLLKDLKTDACDELSGSEELEAVLMEETCRQLQDDEESEETCDDDTCLSQGFDENGTDAEDEDQVSSGKATVVEQQDWELQSLNSVDSADSLCPSLATVDSLVDYSSPEETIIIFDWDDTICPTTALASADGSLAPPPAESREALQDLVNEARLTLEKAREVGAEVVIVTNATDGWVEASCERWLPGLWPTLDMLEFVSARSAWEPTGITSPTGWKIATFEDVIRKFYGSTDWKNIIVVGDSCFEHDALDHVAGLAPQGLTKQCRAKSVRFSQQPSVGVLARELQMLRESFDEIVCHDGNLDLQLQSESL